VRCLNGRPVQPGVTYPVSGPVGDRRSGTAELTWFVWYDPEQRDLVLGGGGGGGGTRRGGSSGPGPVHGTLAHGRACARPRSDSGLPKFRGGRGLAKPRGARRWPSAAGRPGRVRATPGSVHYKPARPGSRRGSRRWRGGRAAPNAAKAPWFRRGFPGRALYDVGRALSQPDWTAGPDSPDEGLPGALGPATESEHAWDQRIPARVVGSREGKPTGLTGDKPRNQT